jgi:hypothetical protein
VLTLSYFDNSFSKIPVATDRITIKVIPSEVFISLVGTDKDPFIELENKSSYEIILSNWILIAGTHHFIIPEGTTILPNKKIKLSPKITGFVGEDIGSVVIVNPSKEIMATYPALIKKPIPKISSSSGVTYNNPISTIVTPPDDSLSENSQIINLNDMEASAGKSGVNIPSSAYPFIGLFIVIGIGIASFVIMKKNQVRDYIDERIRAEDMTIVE